MCTRNGGYEVHNKTSANNGNDTANHHILTDRNALTQPRHAILTVSDTRKSRLYTHRPIRTRWV